MKLINKKPKPLTNFEIQKYYLDEPRFNGVYSRGNLSDRSSAEYNSVEIKGWGLCNKSCIKSYVINVVNEYSDIGTHWVALQIWNNNVTYFDCFRLEHISKEIKTFIGNKNIKTNIFRIQACDSIMCGYFCIGFIDFMLKRNTLAQFTNLSSPNNLK